MNLEYKLLHEQAQAPLAAYAGDAGLDLSTVETLVIEPGAQAPVRTGIALAIPAGYVGLVCPRSGLVRRRLLTVANSPGIIDSNYRGEIIVLLRNMNARNSARIANGTRVAQIVIVANPILNLIERSELPWSERGADGFGSSGE